MKVGLKTKFMKGIASKLIARTIYKKYGYKVNIRIDELDFRTIDGEATLHTNVEIKLDQKDFKKIVKSIGKRKD